MRRTVLVPCSRRGWACGEGHWQVKHSDALVAEARRLRAAGMSWLQLAKHMGLPRSTVREWCLGRRRYAKAVRVRVRLVAEDDRA